MSIADARRCTAASRGVTQLALFDLVPSPAHEPPDPPPVASPVVPVPRPPPGRLVDGASFWAVPFVGDARYHASFGRASALVAVPLAELDAYRAAGVEAIGDGRLAGGSLYLLHPPGNPDWTTERAT